MIVARSRTARAAAALVLALATTTTTRARAADDGGAPLLASKALVLGGYVHTDLVAFRQSSENQLDPSTGQPLNEDRFLLRRARLRLETDEGLFHGAIEIDANTIKGPQVRPFDAEVSIKWPASTPYRGPAEMAQTSADGAFFIVSAGMLMTPFGFEVPERENRRPFLERATMANELVPQSYDLGLRVLGGYKDVHYALAIVNGAPIGEAAFPGRDPDKSKDLVFRVGTSTEIAPRVRVDAGVSGLTGRGFHAGTAPTKDQLVWRDENGNGLVDGPEITVLPGSPAVAAEGFARFAVGADARVHVAIPVVGELAVRAEIVRAKNLDRGLFAADPVAAGRDLRELGFTFAVTQELTRWGMVGVRYDTYDPDADAQEERPFVRVPRDTSRATWAFLAMVRWNKARFVAELDHRQNAFGRTATGAPTTLADDALTFRAVLGF